MGGYFFLFSFFSCFLIFDSLTDNVRKEREERARKNRLRRTRAKELTARNACERTDRDRVTSSVHRSTSVAASLIESLLRRQVGVHSDLIFYHYCYIFYIYFLFIHLFSFFAFIFSFSYLILFNIFIPVTICSCSRDVNDIAGHLASLPDRRLPRMRIILQRQFRKDLSQFLQRPAKGMLKVA